MKPKETISKEMLEYLYYEEGKTLAQIGELFDREGASILYWFRKYGINTIKKMQINKETLERLYLLEKKSPHEIALMINCSAATITNRLKEFNIPIRSGSEALKGRKNTWAHKAAEKNRGKSRPGIGGRKKGCFGWSKGLSKLTDNRLSKTGKSKDHHWNWKGGISTINSLIRQTPQYKLWRAAVFKRDNWRCQNCGVSKTRLQAHHIKSFSDNETLRFNLDNGITLCVSCHSNCHKIKEKM